VGEEAIRKLGKPASASDEAHRARPEVAFACPDASCEVTAPNGAVVATLQITGSSGRVQLSKNEHIRVAIGIVRLIMHADNLIAGLRFETSVFKVECIPTVAGLRPRDWAYGASCRYDGARLTLTVRTMSVALFAEQHPATPSSLSPFEQIILVAPAGGLSLTTTTLQPEIESPLIATLLLSGRIPK
jgi:hypothetical protein